MKPTKSKPTTKSPIAKKAMPMAKPMMPKINPMEGKPTKMDKLSAFDMMQAKKRKGR